MFEVKEVKEAIHDAEGIITKLLRVIFGKWNKDATKEILTVQIKESILKEENQVVIIQNAKVLFI